MASVSRSALKRHAERHRRHRPDLTAYRPPAAARDGTIAGMGSFIYNFVGINDATGTWYNRSVSARSRRELDGDRIQWRAKLASVGGGQFPGPGRLANGPAGHLGLRRLLDSQHSCALGSSSRCSRRCRALQAAELNPHSSGLNRKPIGVHPKVTTDFGPGLIGFNIPVRGLFSGSDPCRVPRRRLHRSRTADPPHPPGPERCSPSR
jgi:hypothetical protein